MAIFIPNNFRATDRIDFLVHFHGWYNTVAGTLDEFKLAEQLAASGKNAILVVPEGPRNAPDSFGGKLEDTNGFKVFMDEVLEKLRASGALAETNFEIGNIILSGHSGGYHVMAAILDHGGLSEKIRETWLFDALYGNTENFVAWQKAENGRLLDIYTDHGGTKEETENLMASMKTNGVSFFAAEDTSAVPENLRTNKLIFLHSDWRITTWLPNAARLNISSNQAAWKPSENPAIIFLPARRAARRLPNHAHENHHLPSPAGKTRRRSPV